MASFEATTDVTSLGERKAQLAEHGLLLKKLLASGAFAEVYKVEQCVGYTGSSTSKTIAAKVYYELAWETRIRHARREYNVVAGLQHENIVAMYDLVVSDNIIFSTMELMDGGELLDHIQVGVGLPPKFGKVVLEDICNGLVYLHETMSLVHLDIKPENILLTVEGNAKLADFDAAIPEGSFVTVVRGTAECHPHEYLPGAPNYFIRSQADVWAAGLVLYECMVGAYPWDSPSFTDPGYADYRTNLKNTHPWNRMPQRTLDMFDSVFTEDVEARAEASELLTYVQNDFLEDVQKIQGEKTPMVTDHEIAKKSMVSFPDEEDPKIAKKRLLALRAWMPPLNNSSKWTVLVHHKEHETHDRFILVAIQPKEEGKIGRLVCEERYSRLLALHRMCTAMHPQYTPVKFPKKKLFGKRTQEFVEQRAVELADYFEEALEIPECLAFYTSVPEFHIVSSDPTTNEYYGDIDILVADGFNYGLPRTISMFDTTSETTDIETASLTSFNMGESSTVNKSQTRTSYYIAPIDVETFEASDIYNVLEPDTPKWVAKSKANRYANILPRWSTRVPLLGARNVLDEQSYINANFVPDVNGCMSYIATQGPLIDTIIDFWRMNWQQRVKTIVMLCKLTDGGVSKCARYWPATIGATSTFGPFRIKLMKTDNFGSYMMNTLGVSVGESATSREFRHFWFNTWPDHGVPATKDGRADPSGVLQLIAHVKKDCAISSENPLVVHCSAGVGRTGTYIVIDKALAKLERYNEPIDLLKEIDEIRHHRMALVQRTSQYKLSWQAIVAVAKHKIQERGGGIIYALEEKMNKRLSATMRRVSMRSVASAVEGGWDIGKVNGKEGFQLRSDAPAIPLTTSDDKDITKQSNSRPKSNKKKFSKRSQVFQASDIGKDVVVSGYNCFGKLRFVGMHKEHGTPRVGVELDQPLGKNNGSINGHKYFECGNLHGVLCMPTKVTIILRELNSNSLDVGGVDILAEDIGCDVLVNGIGMGKLRYLGKHNIDSTILVCGVSFSKSIGNVDGEVNGFRYFTCKPNHGVVVELDKVKRLTPTVRDIGKLIKVKGYDCMATLRYFGPHAEKGHIRCGVELDQPIGNNDGTVNGHTYFYCEPGFGVLCAAKKVSLYYDDVQTPTVVTGYEATA